MPAPTTSASFVSDLLPTLGLLALAAVPLAVTLVLLLRYRFEAFIGLRYLARTGPPGRRPRIALVVAVALGLLGLVLLFGARDRPWAVGLGAVLLLLGGFGALAAATLLRFSVFTTVSAMGLALGVSALVVVLAVTGGFQRDFLARLTSFHGHMVVALYGEPTLDEALVEIGQLRTKLADLPGVVTSGPFAVTVAEVSIGPAGTQLKAIDLHAGPNPLARWMVEGDLSDLGRPATCGEAKPAPIADPNTVPDPNPKPRGPIPSADFVGRVVLGRPLARRVKAKVGDCVMVVIPFGDPAQLQPVALPFRVVGLFEMGFHQHDTHLAYVALDDLRQLESARPFMFGLELVFADPMQAVRLLPQVEARVGNGHGVADWRWLSRGLFSALETQRVLIGLFLSIIILVSAFNLVASLTIIVLTRAREIAILGALGARPVSLLRIFVQAGGVAGLLGTGAGLLAGVAICGLVQAYHFKLDAAVYMIAELPIDLGALDLLVVGGVAQLACLLATIPPVLRARRLAIVDGLRQV